jgi:hypothetical protein
LINIKNKKINQPAATSFRTARLIKPDMKTKPVKFRTMKKLIVALTLVLIAGLSTASAKVPSDVHRRVINAFYSDFKQAKNVSWSESATYVEAQFTLDNKVMFAYYNTDGSLVGTVHHLLTTDLPEELKNSLQKSYHAYWVTELFSMSNDQGTAYFVNLKNGNESLVLRADADNTWTTYKYIPQVR